MALSPVEFAAAFERLRTHVGAAYTDDSSLLQLLDFWPKVAPLTKNPAYSSYVAEYLTFLEAALTDDNLRDLSLAELASLESLGKDVGAREALLQLIRKQTARQCFFVGKLDEGLAACMRITREDVTNEKGEDSTGGLSEFETFHAFITAFNEKWQATKKLLQELAEEWQAEREYVSTDRVYCLLVQNNGIGERSRGKLRALTGTVEERGRSAQNDEVTFDNQLRSSDDPIVGVAYQALAATRRYLRSTGYSRLGSSYYHAHFAINDKRAVYTGDSIGVATALLAYAQLLHTEALRHDHLLPGDVACTGGIDEAGTITPVNGGSISAKVERAFFTHIKYLALPSGNVAAARQHLDALQSRYHARQLILLPIASLSAAVNDHNIVRPERVCIGEFVAKQVVKYSRMTKVQAPMLMVVSYLLLCLVVPKAWILFDWNPNMLKVEGSRIRALNMNQNLLWEYNFPSAIADEAGTWKVTNIDDDIRNEVIILPNLSRPSAISGYLFVFNDNGDSLFAVDCTIRKGYPVGTVDVGLPMPLESGLVQVGKYQGENIIISCQTAQSPARAYISFWSRSGQLIGRYINSGYASPYILDDIDGDGSEEAVFAGINNRLNCPVVFVIDPATARGVSPPYGFYDGLDLSSVERGTQEHYVMLYPSDLNKFSDAAAYSAIVNIKVLTGAVLAVYTREVFASSSATAGIVYKFDESLTLQSAIFDDIASNRLMQMIRANLLPNIPKETYLDTAINRVTYYRNGEYITEGQLRQSKSRANKSSETAN